MRVPRRHEPTHRLISPLSLSAYNLHSYPSPGIKEINHATHRGQLIIILFLHFPNDVPPTLTSMQSLTSNAISPDGRAIHRTATSASTNQYQQQYLLPAHDHLSLSLSKLSHSIFRLVHIEFLFFFIISHILKFNGQVHPSCTIDILSSSLKQFYPQYQGSDFGVLVHLWSRNDVITAWLRLTTTSNCFMHPYYIYKKCLTSTLLCCP